MDGDSSEKYGDFLEEIAALRWRLDDLERAASRAAEMERELNRERDQLLSILESINEIIYVADPHTHEILYCNRALKDSFGKDPTGGVCYREFQGRDTPCEFCTNPIILADPETPYYWEYHNPVLDRDYLIVDRIIRWPDGRAVRFELALDITERKQAERALQAVATELAGIYRAAPVGIGVVSPERVILRVNERLCAMLGWREEELLGKSARMLYPSEEEYERVGREKYREIEEKGTGSIETKWVREDGRVIDVILSSTFLDPEDPSAGTVFTALDITELKRAREYREKTNRVILHLGSDVLENMGIILEGAREILACDHVAFHLYRCTNHVTIDDEKIFYMPKLLSNSSAFNFSGSAERLSWRYAGCASLGLATPPDTSEFRSRHVYNHIPGQASFMFGLRK